MATVTVTTVSGAVVTAEVEGDVVTISQDGHFAGRGRLSAKGRIEDCAARLGAADGSETDATYEALESALAAGGES